MTEERPCTPGLFEGTLLLSLVAMSPTLTASLHHPVSRGYGAIRSHLTLSIPETMPKSSGGKESSDNSTSNAALENRGNKKGLQVMDMKMKAISNQIRLLVLKIQNYKRHMTHIDSNLGLLHRRIQVKDWILCLRGTKISSI